MRSITLGLIAIFINAFTRVLRRAMPKPGLQG